LQLLAVPYSSTHIAEADLFKERNALVNFIQRFSRGHHFTPYYAIEETQISKAFQAFLAARDAAYVREEEDVISSSVHDWDTAEIQTICQYVLWLNARDRLAPSILFTYRVWGTIKRGDRWAHVDEEDVLTPDMKLALAEYVLGLRHRDLATIPAFTTGWAPI
jgi:hypothetical protein